MKQILYKKKPLHKDIYNRKKHTQLKKTGGIILRLLYPPRCAVCDRLLGFQEDGCCKDCQGKLPWLAGAVCMKCGRPLPKQEQEYCSDCQVHRHYFDQGRAAFLYYGGLRKSVYRMKFQNRRDYLPFYGEAVFWAVEGQLRRWRPEQIIPVPMHPKKKRIRGYNQSELLAEELGRRCDVMVNKTLLKCIVRTDEQKKLDRQGRLENLRGIFLADSSQKMPSRVLIVDDVYTTGSTMDEISRTLKEAGVRQVYFAVLCTGR